MPTKQRIAQHIPQQLVFPSGNDKLTVFPCSCGWRSPAVVTGSKGCVVTLKEAMAGHLREKLSAPDPDSAPNP